MNSSAFQRQLGQISLYQNAQLSGSILVINTMQTKQHATKKKPEFTCQTACIYLVVIFCRKIHEKNYELIYIRTVSTIYIKSKYLHFESMIQRFLCPRDRRSGGILFLSCLSFCHSVILSFCNSVIL